MESLSWQAAFPRLDYGQVGKDDRFSLEDGKYYEVSFDAKASVERHIHVQVGELFAEAPWFADALSVQQYIKIGTEMANYSFRFQADASRANLEQLSLLFGHGKLPDGYISEVCDMIYDNIKIVEVDSLGADTMAPSITSNGVTKFFVGDAFDATTIVTVADDQDKAPVLEVLEAESTLPEVDAEGKLTTAGEYTIVYVAKDVAGNESEKFTLNITVVQPVVAGGELIKNNDFSDTTPTADGITDWIIFADSGNTLVGNAADGAMTLTVNNAASAANWNPQFKQAGLEIKEGKVYKLTITLESTVARKVQVAIQNDQWWNMHLDELVELEANVAKTVEFEFTAVAPSPNVLFFLGLGLLDGATVAEIHNVKVSGLSLVEQGGGSDPIIPEPPVVTEEIPAEGLLSKDLSSWIAWAEGAQSISASVVEGKLQLVVNSTSAGVNYSPQFKLEGLSVQGGKTYVVEVVLTSSIARAVQIMLQENGGSWAVVANPIEQLEAGVEKTISFEVKAGGSYANTIFGLMLGKLDGVETPEGEHTIVISKLSLVEKEEEGGEDPIIPEDGNLFVAPETSVFDVEANIYNLLDTWVVWRRDWDPVVTMNHSVENGNLHISGTIPAGVDWWAAQVFYRPSTLGSEKEYTLKMTITANAEMNIQINGKKVSLVAGENKVEIEYTIGNSAITMQLGVDGVGPYVGDFDLVLSEVEIKVKKAEQGGGQETPVENEYFTITANTTAGAANNFSIKWKDAAYKVTKEPTKADCGVSVGIVANFEFIVLNDEFVQVNIITGAEPARNVSIVLHTEAGDYKVTMIIEGGAYVSSTVEKVDCTHGGGSEEGGNEETPVVNEYFDVVANTTAGAANNFSIKWKDAAYKVTKEPTKADCGVSVGIVANFEFIVLNDEFVQVNIITGAEPARNVSIVLHTEAGDYKVTMIIEGGAYVSSTVEKVDCTHVEIPDDGEDIVVDNGNLEVLGAFFYAGNHCEFHFKVADVLFDASYTYTVTCEDYPSGRVINQFVFGGDGIGIQFFIDGSTVTGKTYVFNITVANGDTVLASGQIAVVA